jgi:hypothetical protein
MSKFADTLRALNSALEGLGVGWFLFGAQAAIFRGSRRLTNDIDVTLLLAGESTQAVVASMRREGFSLRVADVDDFVNTTKVLPFVHDPTRVPVDVVLGESPLEELFLQASEQVDVGEGVIVPVATAEHLIVMKLLAGRPKDLDDSTAIARANEVDFAEVELLADALAEGLGEHDILAALAELRRRLARR